MGNSCTKTKKPRYKEAQRRIYVGDVPEVRDAKETPSHPDVNTRGSSYSGGGRNMIPIPVRRQSVSADGVRWIRGKNSYPNNEIITARYSKYSFLPKNIYEQFQRLVNFYFLVIALIQTVVRDSPVTPYTSIIPLTFVIGVTMIKQGYEDWVRHQADTLFNTRPFKVIRNGVLEVIKSKDLTVGDIIKLEGEDQVPADFLLIGSSDEFQRCLINTANLDGESNLKLKYVPPGIPHITDESQFRDFRLIIECEHPSDNLYSFQGCILTSPEMINMRRSLDSLETIEEVEVEHSKTNGINHKTVTFPKAEANGDANVIFSNSQNSTRFEADESIGPAIQPHIDSDLLKHSSKSNGTSKMDNDVKQDMKDFNMIFIGMDNLLMRGAKVKNTDYIYGVIVYTGSETRLALNSDASSFKFSTIEKTMNNYLILFVVYLVILVVCCTALTIIQGWGEDDDRDMWYYPNLVGQFVILFNYIVPISLYVTIEMQKFFGSKFFVWDKDMASDTGSPPLCNTSDINEELGQVEYLFSDKTGTLTENVMKTRIFSVNSHLYDIKGGEIYRRDSENQSHLSLVNMTEEEKLVDFCRTLALCHTIQIMPKRRPSVESQGGGALGLFLKKKKKVSEKIRNTISTFTLNNPDGGQVIDIGPGGNFEFQGSSPDEKALVETCVQLGVSYDGEKGDEMNITVNGKQEVYKRHMVLEFDADRKCMSIIVENSKGEIYLLTKGAETSILPLCDTGPVEDVNKHILMFAMMGLRTLVVARRKLTREQLTEFLTAIKAARREGERRDEIIKQTYCGLERHFEILGATGVEDQLQEGVVETLLSLVAAGIRVWVLTGDKVETAVAVAYSCGLLTSMSKQLMLTHYTDAEAKDLIDRMEQILLEMQAEDNTVIIFDGETLKVALTHCAQLLAELSLKSFRVVCCRMTPLQKAQVVRMVKTSEKQPVTAAVGDGANDVAMIKEAHVGIGIMGKEGRQAARQADFALHRFSYLKKALLVHGHWYYVRLSYMVNYFFYKNIIFILPLLYSCITYNFKNNAKALFDDMFLMMYNIFFTACPILFFGLLEQSFTARDLLNHPNLYKTIRGNALMTPRAFFKWQLLAFLHSLVCYYFVYINFDITPKETTPEILGTFVFCAVVIVANLKLLLETQYVTWYTAFSYFCSFGALFVLTSVYSEADLGWLITDDKKLPYKYTFFRVIEQPVFWILMVIICYTALIPDILLRAFDGSWESVSRVCRTIPLLKRASVFQTGSVVYFAHIKKSAGENPYPFQGFAVTS